MPYAPHFRLTLTGTLGTDSPAPERFAFGVSLAQGISSPTDGGGTSGALQIDNDQFADLVADSVAYFGRATTSISPVARLTEVKLATIGVDGKYTRDPRIAAVNQAGGGNGDVQGPPQNALAISLGTARRGPSGKGRFYVPMPTLGVSPTDLRIQLGAAMNSADSAATWIRSMNNEPGADVLGLHVVIASTKGYNSPVTSVRCGRVMDTIRTRRRSLSESYAGVQAVEINAAGDA